MKILMVNKFLYLNGGSEIYMLKLGAYLQKLGHEIQYFGMKDERNIVGNQYDAYTENVDFHANSGGIVKKLKTASAAVYSVDAKKRIQEVLQRFQPDLVHMNNINFQVTPSIIYVIKEYGIPIIQTVHDVQIACPNHRFYIEHNHRICEQCQNGAFWKCIKNRCVQGSIAKSTLAAVESYYYHLRNTYNLIDIYICPSQFIAARIKSAGVKDKAIHVMYNFSDNVEENQESNIDSPYALYFGRLSQEKGMETLLTVCEKLPDVRVIFAGTGPLENKLKMAAGLYKNIEYVGFKKGLELQNLIAGARFSIYPSEWYENCPLSVIESQALGTPVIGSDLGGIKELIEHGETGLIFMGCNSEALSQSIQKLWDDDLLVSEMRKKCKAKTSNTIETYSNQLLDIYNKLIKQKIYGGNCNGKVRVLADK